MSPTVCFSDNQPLPHSGVAPPHLPYVGFVPWASEGLMALVLIEGKLRPNEKHEGRGSPWHHTLEYLCNAVMPFHLICSHNRNKHCSQLSRHSFYTGRQWGSSLLALAMGIARPASWTCILQTFLSQLLCFCSCASPLDRGHLCQPEDGNPILLSSSCYCTSGALFAERVTHVWRSSSLLQRQANFFAVVVISHVVFRM